MERVADRVDAIDLRMRREHRIRMRAKHIRQFRLIDNRHVLHRIRLQAMHARHDGPRRILQPYRPRDGVRPCPELMDITAGHAVAFVPKIPSDNRGRIFKRLHEQPREANFPADGERIRQNIHAFKSLRLQHAAGHPPCDDADQQLQIVFLRKFQKDAETLHHRLIHACAAEFRVRKRILPHAKLHKASTAAQMRSQRLEVVPSRKNAQHLHAVFRQRLEIRFNGFRGPVAPHVRARVARPIVAADEKSPTVFKYRHVHAFSFLQRLFPYHIYKPIISHA